MSLFVGTPLCPNGIHYRRGKGKSKPRRCNLGCCICAERKLPVLLSWDRCPPPSNSKLQSEARPGIAQASTPHIAGYEWISSRHSLDLISGAVHLNDFWYKSKSFKTLNVHNGSKP